MFAGEKVNVSEQRAALHVALRAPRDQTLSVDGHNVVPAVHDVLDRMIAFAGQVRSGQWRGHTGKPIRTVINIGIGGSDLGPRMVTHALQTFSDRDLRVRFVSNIDGAEFVEATRDLDPAQTLFVVCSKTWHTQETLTNATTARDWLLSAVGGDTAAITRHFVAVSTTPTESASSASRAAPVRVLGLGRWQVLPGQCGRAVADARRRAGELHRDAGRFPRCRQAFRDRTDRAQHSRPDGAAVGLVHHVLRRPNPAVLLYRHYLAELPAYLQQLEMESNGKHGNGKHGNGHAELPGDGHGSRVVACYVQ